MALRNTIGRRQRVEYPLARMRIGFVGSGDVAAALARGRGEPALCTDPDDRARERGGEARESNAVGGSG